MTLFVLGVCALLVLQVARKFVQENQAGRERGWWK